MFVSTHGLLVAADDEGPGHQGPGGRHHVGGQRERDADLEQVAFGHEALGDRTDVVGRAGLHDPEVDGRAPGRLRHGPLQERLPERRWRRRVDHQVHDGRPVTGRGQEGDPDELGPLPGHHEALAVRCLGDVRDGQLLRLGQGRVIARGLRPFEQ